MPIVTDKRRFSLEFQYEWESENGDSYMFPIKYLYGTYGPTIQVVMGTDETGQQQGVELPADMFGEIANFLVQQGILNPPAASPTQQPQQYSQPQMGNGGRPLPLPLLKGVSPSGMAMTQKPLQSNQPLRKENIQQQHQSVPAVEPIQTHPLMPPRTMEAQNINPLAPKGVSTLNVSHQEKEVPMLSQEEILAQREDAKRRAQQTQTFRRGHIDGAYTPPEKSANERAAEAATAIEDV